MGKYYAVKAGRKTGIYTSWLSCKEQVDKFKGAVYKSFSSIEEARKYMGDKLYNKKNSQYKQKKEKSKLAKNRELPFSVLSQAPITFKIVQEDIKRQGRILVKLEHDCGAAFTMAETAYKKRPICPQCTYEKIKNIKDLQKEIEDILGNEYVLINKKLPLGGISKTVLRIKHNLCGMVHLIKIRRFFKYQEVCPCLRASKGERQVAEYLNVKMIKYYPQYIMKAKYIYDFAILNGNKIVALIEFDGEQHFQAVDVFGGEEKFEEQQSSDCKKNQYAAKCKIPLIRIPFNESVYSILDQKLLPILKK